MCDVSGFSVSLLVLFAAALRFTQIVDFSRGVNYSHCWFRHLTVKSGKLELNETVSCLHV